MEGSDVVVKNNNGSNGDVEMGLGDCNDDSKMDVDGEFLGLKHDGKKINLDLSGEALKTRSGDEPIMERDIGLLFNNVRTGYYLSAKNREDVMTKFMGLIARRLESGLKGVNAHITV